MPLKKKRRVAPPPEKPGLARQFIEEHFSNAPCENIKNGHVLHLFVQCDSSFARTVTALKEKLRGEWKIESHHISSLVNKTLKKYKSLSNKSTMSLFSKVCHDTFKMKAANDRERLASPTATVAPKPPCSTVSGPPSPVASTSRQLDPTVSQPMSHGEGTSSSQSPGSSTSAGAPVVAASPPLRISTRKQSNPRKLSLRKQSAFVSKEKRDEKKQHRGVVKELRQALHTDQALEKKHLVQQVKRLKLSSARKDREIKSLKDQLKRNAHYKELVKLKRSHKKLMQCNKQKRGEQVSLAEHQQVVDKLRESESLVSELQNEKLMLMEERGECNRQVTSMKADEKSHAANTRTLVYDDLMENIPT